MRNKAKAFRKSGTAKRVRSQFRNRKNYLRKVGRSGLRS